MKISVIGCGRWGAFIAWYLDRKKHDISLYGRSTSKNMQRFLKDRSNDLLHMPESVELTCDIADVCKSDIIIISINSQSLRGLMQELKPFKLRNKIFVLCMKGLEIGTGKRLSEIVSENTDKANKVAVWLGPGHVQEFYDEIPNCMVIDSADEKTKDLLIEEFSSDIIRFYYGTDIIGNEIGAAAKNVIGIAAGVLDGFGLSSLKGPLMARAPHEISRLISALGGQAISAYGLCHLGDYEATVFSKFSHNRRFGEAFVKNEPFDKLAEGYFTVKAIIDLAKRYSVDLPICSAVYNMLYCGADPQAELNELFTRKLKKEF